MSLEMLTPREREVMQLLIEGRSFHDIGECLGVNHRTIRSHSIAIYSKCDVANRTQLTTRYWQERSVQLERREQSLKTMLADITEEARCAAYYAKRLHLRCLELAKDFVCDD